VTVYRGVHTVPFDTSSIPGEEVNRRAIEILIEEGHVEKGDLVIMTKGDFMNAQGGTNALKIIRIGDEIR
jgi:pyruvate kinase